MKIISIIEDHPEYDPQLCSNGGSYYQPSWKINFDDGTVVEIDDSSCGDFGSRIDGTVQMPDGTFYKCYYGTMLSELEGYTEIPPQLADIVKMIAEATGYHLPVNQSKTLVQYL